eukprot:TRINITY_DN6852_c0_g1_i1.p1 TRINITY_DN6852_c0_g1~~TRINITY_DN6852_c0_g1_i1.p1  ORF type:complete len:683 (-),score=153.87 TRINITY_DN6852_c0_g1_i1:1927-3714(-)
MDTTFASLDIAEQKARNALALVAPTDYTSGLFLPGQILFKTDAAFGYSSIAGGVVLSSGGNILGAIGVSGSPDPMNDAYVARNASAALGTPIASVTIPNSLPRLQDANTRIQNMQSRAATIGTRQASVVVDENGNIVAYYRMDGTAFIAVDLCVRKAVSSALLQINSGTQLNFQPGSPLFTIDNSNGYLVELGGTALLKTASNVIVGALGSSGSYSANVDQDCVNNALGVASFNPLASITLTQALSVIQAALNAAQTYPSVSGSGTGAWCTAAVVDVAGRLVALVSMDGTPPASVDFAIRKARAAALLGMPASVLSQVVLPGVAYSLPFSNGGLVTYSGAAPIFVGNMLVGGVGIMAETSNSNENSIATTAAAAYANGVMVDSLTIPAYNPSHGLRFYQAQQTYAANLLIAARAAIAAASAPSSFAGRDAMGVLRVFIRKDGAAPGSVDLAQRLSDVSFVFPHNSADFQQMFWPNGSYYTGEFGESQRLVALPGGVFLSDPFTTAVLGSVAMSSGSTNPTADQTAAMAGRNAFATAYVSTLPSSVAVTALGVIVAILSVVIIVLGLCLVRARGQRRDTVPVAAVHSSSYTAFNRM